MGIANLMRQSMVMGLLVVSGCDVARSARDDLARLTGPSPASSQMRKSASVKPQATNPGNGSSGGNGLQTAPSPMPHTIEAAAAAAPDDPTLAVAGKTEAELRTVLGAPTSEEEHPPGKLWRYREGKCTLDIQLYPNVETKQFGTLAYKVKSDDNTDEARRLCVAQLQSRLRSQSSDR